MTATDTVRRGVRLVLDGLYPPTCLLCEEPAAETGGLCAVCWRDTPLIAPPACALCGAPLDDIAGGGYPIPCEACHQTPPPWSVGAAATLYEGAARGLVLAFKHSDRLEAARPMARWMVRAGASVLAGGDLVTATPLHWTRRIARRYNQSAELARAVAAEAGLRCDADVIRRVKRTDSQDGKSRAKRERNVAAAFKVPRAAADRVCEKRIVLIDDVLTTGATLTACAHALTAAGAAEVRILVFARVLAARRQTLTAL